MNGPQVLVVGYSGANNTGAEALLRSDIEDLRAVLGKDVHITIPALNPANLRRYVREGPDLEIVPLPSIFFRTIRSSSTRRTSSCSWKGARTWTPGPPRSCGTSSGPPTAPR